MVRPLPEDLQKIAVTQLNEDPKRIESDILAIKEWLKKQPHLKSREDDQWILAFLRHCKFSLERTKEKIDYYLTLKTLLPEFSATDPTKPEIKNIFLSGIWVPLKEPDTQGRKIVLIRASGFDPKKHTVLDGMKCNFLNKEISYIEDDRCVIAGCVLVIDFKGLPMEVLFQINPTLMKKAAVFEQAGFPLSLEGVHYINAPKSFGPIFNMLRSFFNEDFSKKLFFHNDLNSFYEKVPKAALPYEYGGEAGAVDEIAGEWYSKILSYRNWILEEKLYGTEEAKRPGKPKTSSDLFGVEGSFRSLNLD